MAQPIVSASKVPDKNGIIELMRFVMAVVIVSLHSHNLVGKGNCLFIGGAIGVEFFFIVSGFLMAKRVYSDIDKGIERSTGSFLLSKLRGVYPEVIIAWLIGFIFTTAANGYSVTQLLKKAADSFWELTLLHMSGITPSGINNVTWYLSSMLLGMAIIYPILKKHPNKKWLYLIVGMLIAGYLYQTQGSLRDPKKWLHITYKGNLRAIFELCMGIIVYYGYEWLSKLRLKRLTKILLSAAEWGCYIFLLLYMTKKTGSRYDFILVVIFMTAILLSFSHQGISAGLFDNRVCTFLGRLSLSLYLSHFFYAKQLGKVLPEGMSVEKQLAVYFALVFLTALFVMATSAICRKNREKIRNCVSKAFIVSE